MSRNIESPGHYFTNDWRPIAMAGAALLLVIGAKESGLYDRLNGPECTYSTDVGSPNYHIVSYGETLGGIALSVPGVQEHGLDEYLVAEDIAGRNNLVGTGNISVGEHLELPISCNQ